MADSRVWQLNRGKTIWQDIKPTADKTNVTQNGTGHGAREEASEGAESVSQA